MVWVLLILGVLLLVAALLYWQLVLAEGAYLGRRVVTRLYDWSAHVYNRIKAFDPRYEYWFLGQPLNRALAIFPDPLVLDVATGTGRLTDTLFTQAQYRGRLVGLDLSRKMLEQAVVLTKPWGDRITYLWQDASTLPFPDATFDAVSCLEALEFMPDPDRVLAEMVRVLRPGGVLLTTNRIGSGVRWLPGRTWTTEEFEAKLSGLPLEMVRIKTWQEDYDVVWAAKSGVSRPPGLRSIDEILRCPKCGREFDRRDDVYVCPADHSFPIAPDGIIDMAR